MSHKAYFIRVVCLAVDSHIYWLIESFIDQIIDLLTCWLIKFLLQTEGIDTKNHFEISIDTTVDWEVETEAKSIICQKEYEKEVAIQLVHNLQVLLVWSDNTI